MRCFVFLEAERCLASVERFYPLKVMKRFSSLFIPVLLAAVLSACEHYPARDPQVVASPDKVSLMLAESADKVANAMQTLAAVEQQKSPGVRVEPIANAPPELARAMSVNWIGPVAPIAKKLADRASYGFLIVGNEPPVPLVVNIDTANLPVVEILRDIGLQMGERGTIRVDASRRMIELHYAPVSGHSQMGG